MAQGPVVLVGSQLELRRAVAAANRRPGTDRIGLTRSVGLAKGNGRWPGAMRLDLDVTDDLVLNGAGFTINGRGLDRVLDVAPDARLQLNNVTLRGGAPATAGESGGLLRVTGGQARLGRVTLTAGKATGSPSASGGAVANQGGRVVLVSSTVIGNTAAGTGGGVAARGGSTVVRRSALRDNAVAQGSGGGLGATGSGSVTLDDAVVSGNRAGASGGGLSFSRGIRATVRESRVERNVVTSVGAGARGGGGVHVGWAPAPGDTEGDLTLVDSAVDDNYVVGLGPSFSTSGGGLLNDGGTVEIRGGRIAGNTAQADGGGVSAIGGSTTLEGAALTGNSARKADRGAPLGYGGGLALTGGGTVRLSGGTVADNTADSGGGIFNAGSLTATGTPFTGNRAVESRDSVGGGAVHNVGTLVITDADLTANETAGYGSRGGAIFNPGGDLRVERSTLERNVSSSSGGAIAATQQSAVALVDVDVLANSSRVGYVDGGGGLYLADSGVVTYAGGTVARNSTGTEATAGGGLWSSAEARMTLTGVAVVANSAPTSPQAHQAGTVAGGFTINGQVVPTGDNRSEYPNP